MSQPVFVFGSNLAGRHGKGAALYARQHHGAIYGRSFGRQGNSYAIPTKDAHLLTLPLAVIARFVETFLEYARVRDWERFEVTAIGCGLAGLKPENIAPMFLDAPENCELAPEFEAIVGRQRAARLAA